ncbi:MAG TPA: hypothetical protein VNN80_26545 [Polyangiaceae bacterium]|nr:hypothetical protein [Polyangiaceae bacterium]
MGRLRARFLRACVELIHQETGGTALPRLREGLPPHLRGVLAEVLSNSERDASHELGPGLELLLAIDRVLCGGSGVVTTRIAASLASRVLSQSAGLVVAGDAVATLLHLRAPFEHPFIDVELQFSARRLPDGFALELDIGHDLRTASWLSSAGLGYAKAATRFSGEGSARLRLYSEVAGGTARVLGRHTEGGVLALGTAARGVGPTARAGAVTSGSASGLPGAGSARDGARPLRRRSAPTNAAERVAEILSRAPGHGVPASEPRALPRAWSRPSNTLASSSESGVRARAATEGGLPLAVAARQQK